MEVCKSHSASGIELKIYDYPKVVVLFFCFELCSFFFSQVRKSCTHRSQHIAAQALQKFNRCDFAASTQAFIVKAGTACEHWCPYIERRRALLCVLLTHVWKPGFICSTIA